MTDEYRDLLDTETILPGDEVYDIRVDVTGAYLSGVWTASHPYAFRTPRECRGRFRRPIAPKPPAEPKPTIAPCEGWRLLRPGEVIEDGDEFYSVSGGEWLRSGQIGGRVTQWTYRRRVVRSVHDIHLAYLAYIHRHPSPDEDVLPSMRYAIVCADGVRRHAATLEDAVAVFDDAVRWECERKGVSRDGR